MVETIENLEAEVEEIEVFVPQEALEAVDLEMPREYEVEIMASELVSYLTQYRSAVAGQKAARQNEDHQRAEQFAKVIAFTRSGAALVQHQYPETKAIAAEIMTAQAGRVKRMREAGNA